MRENRYVAAIEIGSSKIIGAIGRTDGSALEIIAVEQTKGVEMVRHGVIQNLEAAASAISVLLDRLEDSADIDGMVIDKLFVGISGRSLRNIPVTKTIKFDEEKEITAEDVERLRSLAENSALDSSLLLVDLEPRSYQVDRNQTMSPVGMYGKTLEGVFDLIVCRPVLERNIKRTIEDKLGITIAGVVATPLAMGHLLVKNDEKRGGCMLVDIGAETTTVMIYRGGAMTYLATLPLGGRNITLDLMSLSISEERAEAIKLQSGRAIAPDTKAVFDIDGVRNTDVTNLVTARAEEIAANICEQMEYAGLQYKDLPNGIIALGGGFKLNGMTDLVAQQCNLSVRNASLPEGSVIVEDKKAPASEIMQLASILYTAATLSDVNCMAPVQPEEPAQEEDPKGQRFPESDDDEEEYRRPASEKKKKKKKPSALGKLAFKLRQVLTYGGDDDDDTEIE